MIPTIVASATTGRGDRLVDVVGKRLIGREPELDRLRGAVRDACASRGSVVALVGEPGIGKTRLATELSRHADELGMRVAWGRCWEAGGAPVGWPWREALRTLFALGDGPRALEELGDRARWVAGLAPELGIEHAAPSTDPRTARFFACDAVASLLASLARDAPIALVLDDLHAADGHSAEILRFVARALRGWPLLVVGTWRELEATTSADVSEHLAAVRREAAVVTLRPLARSDAEQLARATAAPGASDGALNEILDASGGNPLFVEELAATWGTRRSGEALPRVIEDALDGHLARLSLRGIEVARLAAIFGRRFDLGALRRACREAIGLSEEATTAALAELVEARVIVDEGSGAASFRHMLVRDTLARRIEAPRAAALHAAVLATLDDLGAPPSELAHHALAGIPEVDAREAARYARTAAAEASRALAFDDALSLLHRAVEVVDGSGLPPDRGTVELRIELARMQIFCGRVAEGKKVCERAADLADRIGAADLLAMAALAHGLEFTLGTTDRVMISLLERSLAALGEEPSSLRARVLARYATALYPHRDMRVPVTLAREAVALARTLDDPPTLLEVIDRGRLPLVLSQPFAEWGPLQEEVMALSRAHGDERQQMLNLCFTGMTRLAAGNVAGAEAALAEAMARAERMGQPQQQVRVHLLHSMLALRAGRWEESELHQARARALADTGAVSLAVRVFDIHAFGIARIRRDRDVIARDRDRFAELLTHFPNGYALMAWVYAFLGDMAAVERELARREALLWGRPLAIHSLIGEAATAVGNLELAREIYELLLPRAGEALQWGMVGMITEGSVDGSLGRLAAALGMDDASDAHFEDAVAIDERTGCRPGLAHALADWGRALLRSGRREAHARALLARAAEVYGELGLAERAAEARTDGGATSPTAPTARTSVVPLPTIRFEDDGEMLAVTFEGATFRVKDGKGMRYLAHLVAHPGVEVSAIALVGDTEAIPDSVAWSDAGEVLDERARKAYAQRLTDLREDLEEAEQNGDLGHAEKARAEIDALEQALREALGLGGRVRRAGSIAERARINVQRRIRAALAAIGKHAPELGAHLERSVRTGACCIYDPPATG